MADDVRVEIDPAYVEWLRTSTEADNPALAAISEVADLVLAEAIALAPVSLHGSRHAPPGFTKSKIRKSDPTHGDDGAVLVLVGTRTNRHGGAYPYPLAFVANAAGSTWNRGRKSKRAAVDDFLTRALDATPVTVVWE